MCVINLFMSGGIDYFKFDSEGQIFLKEIVFGKISVSYFISFEISVKDKPWALVSQRTISYTTEPAVLNSNLLWLFQMVLLYASAIAKLVLVFFIVTKFIVNSFL